MMTPQGTTTPAPDPPEPGTDWLTIGRIVSPQGIRGEVRVYPDSDFPERFLTPGQRWLRSHPDAAPQSYTLVAGRSLPNKGLYVLQFAEVQNREQAEALRQGEIVVPRSDRPPLESGEYHVSDLVGLEVRLQGDGSPIGVVVDVFAAGNDLLAVQLTPPPGTPAPKQPILIPFVHAIVPTVDLAAGYVEITPPPGLLEG